MRAYFVLSSVCSNFVRMKQNQASLSSKQYAVPFILITSLFFMWGFARAILDVLNKHFQNALDISITQSALIQVTTYLGYFLMAIPAGLFINRQGYRRGVVSGPSCSDWAHWHSSPARCWARSTPILWHCSSSVADWCSLRHLPTHMLQSLDPRRQPHHDSTSRSRSTA